MHGFIVLPLFLHGHLRFVGTIVWAFSGQQGWTAKILCHLCVGRWWPSWFQNPILWGPGQRAKVLLPRCPQPLPQGSQTHSPALPPQRQLSVGPALGSANRSAYPHWAPALLCPVSASAHLPLLPDPDPPHPTVPPPPAMAPLAPQAALGGRTPCLCPAAASPKVPSLSPLIFLMVFF